MEPSTNTVPNHVGIIMDGNRRLAKRLMMKPWKGHEWGAERLQKVLQWCEELKIKELTLYSFSIENFNRPKEEFDYLMDLFNRECNKFLEGDGYKINQRGLKINFIGRISMFPQELQDKMHHIMDSTRNNTNGTVNFAMAYGGRTEIIDAVKKISDLVKSGNLSIDEINEQSFKDFLYTKDEPELIIRTGGEKRTSNFLPYQSAYSEWIFVDKYWPEFEKEDFLACINEFQSRERRFGK